MSVTQSHLCTLRSNPTHLWLHLQVHGIPEPHPCSRSLFVNSPQRPLAPLGDSVPVRGEKAQMTGAAEGETGG